MFTLNIDTSNAAFDGTDEKRTELQRIIGTVADSIGEGHTRGTIRDVNGNTVGSWLMSD